MSDHIPFEIQSEIIKRLPIKPLVQCRSVSKQWKSLIDSSKFIADYHVHKTQPQNLLVSYTNGTWIEECVLMSDNDTFPRRMFPLTVPMSVQGLLTPSIFSSQGLLCVYCTYELMPGGSGDRVAVIWNPTIRKSVSIVVPDNLDSSYEIVVGFGVCPKTCDPKLVKVGLNHGSGGSGTIVEVFALGVGAWRRLGGNMPRKSIALSLNNAAIGSCIYWNAYEEINTWEGGSQRYDLIVSFDMISEEFKEIRLPDSLALDVESSVYVSKMRESLVVIQTKRGDETEVYSVWEMEHGVSKSFKKLFTINPEYEVKNVHGFRKSGEALIEMGDEHEEIALFSYEPNSKNMTCLWIRGKEDPWFVSSYMESLLLLDH
ncbi:putative F-box domain-containing protein [Tanacetum coccineum]